MAKGISNTSRTLRYIRAMGWPAQIVERFNAFAGVMLPSGRRSGIRIDLFGVIDIIALTGPDSKGPMGIQSCGQDFAAHNRKILTEPMVLEWLQEPAQLMLIGWRKIKLHKGGKAMRWAPRVAVYQVNERGEVESEVRK